jgi:hypothetical protein
MQKQALNSSSAFFIAAAVALQQPTAIAAPTVVENTNLQFEPAPTGFDFNYRATVAEIPVPIQPGTVSFFQYDSNTLSYRGGTADYFQVWYLVQAGYVLTDASRFNGEFPVVPFNPPAMVGPDDFYLGTIIWPVTEHPKPPVTAFGWVRLHTDGDTLSMIANAVAYDAHGIIVGTNTAIPEPKSLAMLTAASLSVLTTSGRRKK